MFTLCMIAKQKNHTLGYMGMNGYLYHNLIINEINFLMGKCFYITKMTWFSKEKHILPPAKKSPSNSAHLFTMDFSGGIWLRESIHDFGSGYFLEIDVGAGKVTSS